MKKCVWFVLLLSLFSLLAAAGAAERNEWLRLHPGSLPIWLTDDELDLVDTIGRDFSPTDPPTGPVRQVAEFEPMYGALIRWSSGLDIPYSLVAEMSQDAKVVTIVPSTAQQNSALTAYANNGANTDNCLFLVAATNSVWTRDYGPWFVFDGNNELGVVNFIYNRPRPDDNDIPIEYAAFDTLDLYGMSVEHTGGNYMCDGLGQAASTSLVLDENPSLTQTQIEGYLADFCGIDAYHILPDPLGDYIEHIDCWGKYLSVDKVMIGRVPATDSRYEDFEYVADYFAGLTSSWGTPMQVFRVDTPGTNPQTPYTNCLILNDKVFIPQTGHSLDDDAIAAYQAAMPGYQIIGVSYTDWLNTDALHCRVHELPDKGMLYVHHMPQLSPAPAGAEVPINAYVYAHSDAALIADSLLVYYRATTQSAYSTAVMTDQGDHCYQAVLPGFAPGDTVAYYIHAADESGRHANHPFIGAPDPHTFTVQPDTTAPMLAHDPLPDIYLTDLPLTVTAQASDDYAIAGVSMLYAVNGGEQETLALENAEDDVWSGLFNPVLATGDSVAYYLQAADPFGNITRLPLEGVYSFLVMNLAVDDGAQTAGQDMLLGCCPNPFSGAGTSVRFYLTAPRRTAVEVYNVRGQRVCTVQSGSLNAGMHSVRWNGQDDAGRAVGSGVYFVRLNTGNAAQVRKVMVLR